MKSKKEEYKELSDKDLKERVDAEVLSLNQLRINHTITPLDNSSSLKEKRRDIARLHTEIRARELKKD